MKVINAFTLLLAGGAFVFSLLNWINKPGSTLVPESANLNKADIIKEYLDQKKAEAKKFFLTDSIVSEQIKNPATAKGYKDYFLSKYNPADADGNHIFFSSVAMDSKFFDAFITLYEPKGFRIYLMSYPADIEVSGIKHKKGDVSVFLAPINNDGKIDDSRIYNYGDPCKPPCPDDVF